RDLHSFPTRRSSDLQYGLPCGISHLGGQVHDGLDAGEGGLDRFKVGDVGLVARQALDGAPVQGAQIVATVDLFPQRAADEAAQRSEEHTSELQSLAY